MGLTLPSQTLKRGSHGAGGALTLFCVMLRCWDLTWCFATIHRLYSRVTVLHTTDSVNDDVQMLVPQL